MRVLGELGRRTFVNGSRDAAEVDGVYPAREDSSLLLRFAAGARRGSRVLDIGCGSGVLSLAASAAGARTVATDLSSAALRHTRATARAQGMEIPVVRSDAGRGLRGFDRILANPPYLPLREAEDALSPGDRMAVDGGPDGCATTAKIVAELPRILARGGEAFVLTSTLQESRRLRRIFAPWRRSGRTASRVAVRELEGERLEVHRLRFGPRVTRAARGGR